MFRLLFATAHRRARGAGSLRWFGFPTDELAVFFGHVLTDIARPHPGSRKVVHGVVTLRTLRSLRTMVAAIHIGLQFVDCDSVLAQIVLVRKERSESALGRSVEM